MVHEQKIHEQKSYFVRYQYGTALEQCVKGYMQYNLGLHFI